MDITLPPPAGLSSIRKYRMEAYRRACYCNDPLGGVGGGAPSSGTSHATVIPSINTRSITIAIRPRFFIPTPLFL
ncbi:MAG TPA: hypothetical protein ENN79_11065 [Desulfobacteraceae bacterium]|nr:hypothetical protein [Desulfobacteraceae bacterium]